MKEFLFGFLALGVVFAFLLAAIWGVDHETCEEFYPPVENKQFCEYTGVLTDRLAICLDFCFMRRNKILGIY